MPFIDRADIQVKIPQPVDTAEAAMVQQAQIDYANRLYSQRKTNEMIEMALWVSGALTLCLVVIFARRIWHFASESALNGAAQSVRLQRSAKSRFSDLKQEIVRRADENQP